nr:hypothetical protein [Mycoplasmopsis bovis]
MNTFFTLMVSAITLWNIARIIAYQKEPFQRLINLYSEMYNFVEDIRNNALNKTR